MNSATARVTISLPAELLQAVDARLARPDDTRSAVIRRLIEKALREAEERADVERWIQSYREQPPTPEEDSWVDLIAYTDASDVPWE